MSDNKVALDQDLLAKVRARDVYGLVAYYEGIFPQFTFPPHMIPVAMALCDLRIRKLAVIIGPGSGKSLLLSVCFPAWNLGHDLNQTNLGISASEGLIQGFVRASMELVEWSPWHKAIFPDCKPDKDAGWSAANGAYVEGRNKGNPDPSYVGAGLTSKSLTGKHAKTLILDDLHDAENSNTAEQRQKVIDKYYSQLMGRQDPQGARIILAGRRWATDDLYGHLMDTEADWVFMSLPAERKVGSDLFWDISVPDGLVCCFSET